jgi:flagellar basal-body rod protein FlgC
MALEDIFNTAGSALNAQTTRMNTTASNLANAATVAGSEEGAFRAKRAVFKSILADQMGDSSGGGIRVDKIIDDPSPIRKMSDQDKMEVILAYNRVMHSINDIVNNM